MQSHDGQTINIVPKYNNTFHAIKSIFQTEGVIGLYRGSLYNYLSTSFATAIFFSLY